MVLRVEKVVRIHRFDHGLKISATATHDPWVVQEWITTVSNFLRKEEIKIVGLDVEFTDYVCGVEQCAAVLQLFIGEDCLVHHIVYSPNIQSEFHKILSRENILFYEAAISKGRDVLGHATLISKAPSTYSGGFLYQMIL